MQRLFTMFPTGSPGIALLIMRVALGTMMVQFHGPLTQLTPLQWAQPAGAVIALALCVGVFTPLFCIACAGIQLTTWAFGYGDSSPLHICILLSSVAVGLLGPGAYSIDGRVYGRRRLHLPEAGADADES